MIRWRHKDGRWLCVGWEVVLALRHAALSLSFKQRVLRAGMVYVRERGGHSKSRLLVLHNFLFSFPERVSAMPDRDPDDCSLVSK